MATDASIHTRSRVLALLNTPENAYTAQQIAQILDIHPTTARFHLENLVKEKIVERINRLDKSPASSSTSSAEKVSRGPSRGRPHTYYRRLESTPAYITMIQILATAFKYAPESGREYIIRAGYEVGLQIAREHKYVFTSEDPEAIIRVLTTFGFNVRPYQRVNGKITSIEILSCPLGSLTKQYTALYYAYQGMLRGVLQLPLQTAPKLENVMTKNSIILSLSQLKNLSQLNRRKSF